MSIFDLDQLSKSETIAQYIIELREKGHMLPYDDYKIIKSWMDAIKHDDENLLIILSDILPLFYENRKSSGPPPSLKSINRKVLKNIHEFSGRQYD